MKHVLLVFLIYACGSPQKPTPVVAKPPIIKSSLDSVITSVQKSQDRFCFVLSIVAKRDSFLVKKYENEVLYYQTQNDKYRRKCNRMVDSISRYVRILDSLAKQLK